MPSGVKFELNFKQFGYSAGRVLEEEIGITGTPLTGVILVLVATPSTGVDFVLVLELLKLSTQGTGSLTGVDFFLAIKLFKVSTGRGFKAKTGSFSRVEPVLTS